MKNCTHFIQLLSDEPQGIKLAAKQLEAAKANNLTILQWRSPEINMKNVQDPELKTLLDGHNVRAMNIEEFKLLIRQRITEKPAPEKPVHQFVFLNASEEDHRLARNVGNIIKQLGLAWRLRQDEGSTMEIRYRIESNIKDCNGFLVFYGQVGHKWVEQQFVVYQRVRRKPMPQAVGLYEGPPEKKVVPEIAVSGVTILDCTRGIDEIQLRDFLKPLLEVV